MPRPRIKLRDLSPNVYPDASTATESEASDTARPPSRVDTNSGAADISNNRAGTDTKSESADRQKPERDDRSSNQERFITHEDMSPRLKELEQAYSYLHWHHNYLYGAYQVRNKLIFVPEMQDLVNSVIEKADAANSLYKEASNDHLWYARPMADQAKTLLVTAHSELYRLHLALHDVVRYLTYDHIRFLRKDPRAEYTKMHAMMKAEVNWIRHVARRLMNHFVRVSFGVEKELLELEEAALAATATTGSG